LIFSKGHIADSGSMISNGIH